MDSFSISSASETSANSSPKPSSAKATPSSPIPDQITPRWCKSSASPISQIHTTSATNTQKWFSSALRFCPPKRKQLFGQIENLEISQEKGEKEPKLLPVGAEKGSPIGPQFVAGDHNGAHKNGSPYGYQNGFLEPSAEPVRLNK